MSSGIYKIENLTNNKVYIGSSNDITRRRYEHTFELRSNSHYNTHLQNSWNKYGEENFKFDTIEYCKVEELFLREQFYIDLYNASNSEKGYNKNPKAGSNYNTLIPVVQISLEGDIIKIFPSIQSATADILGFDNRNNDGIGAAVRGNQKSAFGFFWILYNENSLHEDVTEYLRLMDKSILIEQIDKSSGEVVGLFNKMKEAELAINKNEGNSSIRDAMESGKLYSNYYWRRFVTVPNRKSSYYMGIDPGFGGYISLIGDSHIFSFPIPRSGTSIDIDRLNNFLKSWKGYVKHCVIEDVHAIFGAAAKATFNFGWIVGVLEGCIVSHKIPFTKVQPKKWQKEMWEGIPLQQSPSSTGKTMKTDTKKMSLLSVKRLFPNEDLRRTERSKKDDDNKVDSLLIAEYCRRKF